MMAFEQSYQENTVHFGSDEEFSLKQKCKATTTTPAPENVNGCFDCNICLDSANDPVVTLCGHLYCWPCIYKWLHVQTSSPDSTNEQQPKCPVCKSNISTSSLVPLYGRGKSKRPQLDLVIPRRPPPALGVQTQLTTSSSSTANGHHHHLHPNHFRSQPPSQFHRQLVIPHPYGNYASMEPLHNGGGGAAAMTNGMFRPTVGIFGEMVFARMFGNSADTSLFGYPYPPMGSGSPRIRRQEMHADKSLNRVSVFLFCCFILCLLLF